MKAWIVRHLRFMHVNPASTLLSGASLVVQWIDSHSLMPCRVSLRGWPWSARLNCEQVKTWRFLAPHLIIMIMVRWVLTGLLFWWTISSTVWFYSGWFVNIVVVLSGISRGQLLSAIVIASIWMCIWLKANYKQNFEINYDYFICVCLFS